MSAKTVEQIMERVKALPEPAQLIFLHSLENYPVEPKIGPLAKHFGVIDQETGKEMERIIEECFEQVNPDEWNRLP